MIISYNDDHTTTIVTERDRIRRLEAVAEAARAAGPWPKTTFNPYIDQERCVHCHRFVISRSPGVIQHSEFCSGIALRDALARLEAADGT